MAPSKRRPKPPFCLYENPESTSFQEGWTNVVNLLKDRKNIVVICGAGLSVSCGIPDFRSPTGLYATLNTQELGLTCPEDLFDLNFFQEDPQPFYTFAKHLYFPHSKSGKPRPTRPSDAHKLLALLEENKMLLRVYSQNIDGLEEVAGVTTKRVCYAHGSLQWATCGTCKQKVRAEAIRNSIWNGKVPTCQLPLSNRDRTRRPSRKRSRRDAGHQDVCGGVFKPNITFFGEALQRNVNSKLESDREKVDALIVIGTSLSVAPISKVIEYLPKGIPRILINQNIVHPPSSTTDENDDDASQESLDFRGEYVFDAYLLGFCDDVTRALGQQLFGKKKRKDGTVLSTVLAQQQQEEADDDATFCADDWENITVPPERVFLFPGAKPPAPPENEVSYCEIARCDGCNVQIKGTIYKCADCFDYDLCRKCYPTLSKTHYDGKHHFVKESSRG